MPFKYRPLLPDEETEFFAVTAQALTIDVSASWTGVFTQRIGAENLRAVLHDGQLAGGLGIYRMGQWFGGRTIPCGGVSVVGIAPEFRGRGLARFALRSLLEELHADGTPLACLFPSTQQVYRSVGFEQAGSRCRYKLPLSSIGLSDRDLPVTRIDPQRCAELFAATAEQRARRSNGNLQRTPGLWQRITQHPDKTSYCGVIGPMDAPQGFVSYRYEECGEQSTVHVHDMAAVTPAAVRRLWTFLADHRSIPTHVTWSGPPTEPLLLAAQECKRTPVEMLRWMLRIVDVKGALQARGYPPDVRGEVHFDITDDLLPRNSGRWVLQVSDGNACVASGGNGEFRLDIRGLAPLYSSFLPPDALRSTGLIDCGDDALAIATRIFAGPEPWMPEIF
jgi:predicted acetyltransferase